MLGICSLSIPSGRANQSQDDFSPWCGISGQSWALLYRGSSPWGIGVSKTGQWSVCDDETQLPSRHGRVRPEVRGGGSGELRGFGHAWSLIRRVALGVLAELQVKPWRVELKAVKTGVRDKNGSWRVLWFSYRRCPRERVS
jgi:hypothetical protein